MKSGYIVKQLIGTLVFFSILFLGAGRICYWQGLIYTAIGIVMMILSYTCLLYTSNIKPYIGIKTISLVSCLIVDAI